MVGRGSGGVHRARRWAGGRNGQAAAGAALLRGAGGCPGDSETDLLVPLVLDAVRTVDLERREIEIDLHFLGEE